MRGLAGRPAECGRGGSPHGWEVRNEMAGWASPCPLHASATRRSNVEGSPHLRGLLRMPSGKGRLSCVLSPQVGLHPRTGAVLGQRGLPPPPMYFLGEVTAGGGTCQVGFPARVTEDLGSNSSLGSQTSVPTTLLGPGQEKTQGAQLSPYPTGGTSRTTGHGPIRRPNWDNEHLKVRTRTPPVDRPGPGSPWMRGHGWGLWG